MMKVPGRPRATGELNEMKKAREQVLRDIDAAARFLSLDRQRELNAQLRKLVAVISAARK